MLGKELGCRLHIVTAQSNMLLNLANCMSRCQIEIANIALAIYASSVACLTEDEQNLGSFIIDIGAKTTSFGIVLGKKLLYTGHVPVGSWHITSDIAKALSINIDTAEKLKVLYGSALNVPTNRDHVIDLEALYPETTDLPRDLVITTTKLAGIIGPRVDEILELVKESYDLIGVDHLIARRIVLTGGGSMLRGIKERASIVFGKQTRIGRPLILPGFAEDSNSCIYTVAIGMVKLHAMTQQKNYTTTSTQYNHDSSLLNKVVIWLKENI
jgi:cell division protein FtsA